MEGHQVGLAALVQLCHSCILHLFNLVTWWHCTLMRLQTIQHNLWDLIKREDAQTAHRLVPLFKQFGIQTAYKSLLSDSAVLF